MKLKKVQITLYRNIVDSNVVPIESDVTCLVGKNESGKTAFLQALYSLNPAYPDAVRVDVTHDYPRWRKVRDERKYDLDQICPVKAYFSLDKSDFQALTGRIPLELPVDTVAVATRNYNGDFDISLSFAEKYWIDLLVDAGPVNGVEKKAARDCDSLQELVEFIKEKRATIKDKRTKKSKALDDWLALTAEASEFSNGRISAEIKKILENQLPEFFYFSEYSSLAGRIDLTDLLKKQDHQLEDHERTALSLLKLVGVQGTEFMDEDFEVRVAELEAAANEITNQVFEYWTQNEDLIVRLVGDSQTILLPQGSQSVVHRFVDIRLNDLRHQMTTNFETRSSGFQWFFSFLTAFSDFEEDQSLIILLDEPGLGLHARAQEDLLQYIDERLGTSNQVIYTTHSPFMVNPKNLERVRLVEDLTTRKNPNLGAQVSTDVLAVHGDTLFPLQAALGYDLAQNLFVGGHNLIVEGPSDLVFLLTMSDHLAMLGQESLDQKWTIVPVGGIDKIPTFVALLGAHLDVTVLIDATGAPNQRLLDMVNRSLLDSHRLLSIDRVTGKPNSDIEDLFTNSEYLNFYNKAYNDTLTLSDLRGNDSIIHRIERHIYPRQI
jgi:predicted ATPase